MRDQNATFKFVAEQWKLTKEGQIKEKTLQGLLETVKRITQLMNEIMSYAVNSGLIHLYLVKLKQPFCIEYK